MSKRAAIGVRFPAVRVARCGSGLSLIVSPVLWLASSGLGPSHQESRTLTGMLPFIEAHPDRFLASVLIGLLSLAFLVPAVVAIAALIRRRRPLLAVAGSALVIIGTVSLAVVYGVQLVQHEMVVSGADRGQMVALLQRLEGAVGMKLIVVGFTLGLFLGWVTLAAGLFGAVHVPNAMPLAVLASLPVNFVGLEVVSRVVFLIGLGWLGVLILKEDAATARTGAASHGPQVAAPDRPS